jgi:tetratricopeptide (TPR) repeat protein
MRAILILAMTACLASAATAQEAESKAVQVQHLYDKAFQHYTGGEYSQAINLWEDILRLDPEQKTARQMIKDVTIEIKQKNANRLGGVYTHIRAGRYRSALAGLETLLGDQSQALVAPDLQGQLEEIVAILPSVPGKTKAWRMTALAIDSSIGMHQDLRLAHNAFRYAQELDGNDARIKRLFDWFLARHPDLASSDAITPGMTLLEFKRFVALDHLYAGKHHLAVGVLNEILTLEPSDLVALKRLGSAYYSLGLNDNARQAWKRALALSPKDAQLKKFLQKLSAKTASRPRR